MALLEVKNINSGYGKKQVLYDVSFEIERGEIALLIGSNGSGKSTVLKTIYGLLPVWNDANEGRGENHEKGSIHFDGEDITGLKPSELLNRGLLYVPQKDNLFADLSVRENLEIAGLALNNGKLLRQRIDNALDTFPILVPILDRTPIKLSGGERQLLALAMANLHKPKMLMLDEPLAGLSEKNTLRVLENLKKLNENLNETILIVEHRIKDSYVLARKIISLKIGKIVRIDEIILDLNVDSKKFHDVFV